MIRRTPGVVAFLVICTTPVLLANDATGTGTEPAARPSAGIAPVIGDTAEAFRKATEAYEAGHFPEAVEGFRRLLDAGYSDARVHYNLSCALYRAGDLGGAVLHAETAARLDPADADTRDNLSFLRGRIVDKDSGPDGFSDEAVVRLVDRFTSLARPNMLAALVLAGEWIAAAGLYLAWRRHRRGRSAGVFWAAAAVAGIAALAAASGVAIVAWRRESVQEAVVLTEKADALAGPGSTHPVLFSVHAGLKVRISGEREGWVQCRLPSGLSGWLQGDELGRIELP